MSTDEVPHDGTAQPPRGPSPEVAATLGLHEAGDSGGSSGRWAVIAVTTVVVAVLVLSRPLWGREELPVYQTEEVVRGRLVQTISATGALAPVIRVDVGTEFSGILEEVLVDFNEPVARGQLLARINTERLEASTAQARANLALAEAQRDEAAARVRQADADLQRLRRVHELSGGEVPSDAELDAGRAAYDRAVATAASMAAQIDQAQATLDGLLNDLRRSRIEAPVDGVVLDRRVEAGQTVASSFQTPILFTIAGDLSEMEVSVDVDEADVGLVREGQAATFTVDAYPDRAFPAFVSEVRYAPRTVSGVVTYETTLGVNNADLLLRPGMTATAEIVVGQVDEAILVPNAALRFTPSEWQPEDADGGGEGLIGGLIPRPDDRRTGGRGAVPRVWLLRDGEAVPVDVETGPSDGLWTVVGAGALSPGDEVIADELEVGPR